MTEPLTWRNEAMIAPAPLPLIYTSPGYTITFVAVIVISRVPEVIGASRWRSRRDPTARQVDRGSFVVMSILAGGGVIVACVLAAIWTAAAIPWLRPQVTLAGLVVILLGAALRCGGGRSSLSGGTSPSMWRCAPRSQWCIPGRIASCAIPLTRPS
ncbi:MAG: hypothetical protein ACHQ0J_09820 [Candidatus Dormibacterales bacterium]